jgi:hypothetical protein
MTAPETDEPDLPDSGMASGSDAGGPGERLGRGDLRPDEQRLLAALLSDAWAGTGEGRPAVGAGRPDADAELRAAGDEVPLPGEGGAPADGLTAEFSAPEPG